MLRSFIVLSFLFNKLLCVAQDSVPLLQAIKNNDLSLVTTLLDKGAPIAVKDADGDNVLMYAALYASPACMELLLKKGADPNSKNKLGETALIWSAHDIEKTKLLLQYKADANSLTRVGGTPFLAACVGSDQQAFIRLLLEYGADVHIKNRKGTSLMHVAMYGDTTSARILFDRGVDINATAEGNQTALFLATKSVNTPMVKWLLSNGADANVKDEYKATSLSYAVIVNDLEMVNMLLAKTDSINRPDIDGMTYLMWAAYNEHDNATVIQALIDKGALLDPKDKNGLTALDWALKKGDHTAIVELLRKEEVKRKKKP